MNTAGTLGGNKPGVSFEGLKKYPLTVQENLRSEHPIQRVRIIADSVHSDFGIIECAVLSSGDVDTPRVLVRSLLLANGNVKVGGQLVESVVVCDGDVEVNGILSNSVIIARGTVRVKGIVADSVIIKGKNVLVGDFLVKTTVIKDKRPKRFGSVFPNS